MATGTDENDRVIMYNYGPYCFIIIVIIIVFAVGSVIGYSIGSSYTITSINDYNNNKEIDTNILPIIKPVVSELTVADRFFESGSNDFFTNEIATTTTSNDSNQSKSGLPFKTAKINETNGVHNIEDALSSLCMALPDDVLQKFNKRRMKKEFNFLKSINRTITANVNEPIKVTVPMHMGIEGSGHTMMSNLYSQIVSNMPSNSDQVKFGQSIFMNLVLTPIYSPSYPTYNTFYWPDFNELISQIDAVADLFPNIEVEVKVIVLKRKWIEAIASSCRRFGKCDEWKNGTMNRPQANFKGALMIDEQLKKIEKSNWMMLDYNELIENPMHFGAELASFWNIESDAINKSLESIHSPKESEKADIWNKLSQKYGQDLCDYMNDKFYSNATVPNGLAGTMWTN